MTIFEHIESIKNQCESLLKELKKESPLKEESPLDTWFHQNMNQDLENLDDILKDINFKKNNNGNK